MYNKWENSSPTGMQCTLLVPMSKGQKLTDIRTNCTGSDAVVRFIVAKGGF